MEWAPPGGEEREAPQPGEVQPQAEEEEVGDEEYVPEDAEPLPVAVAMAYHAGQEGYGEAQPASAFPPGLLQQAHQQPPPPPPGLVVLQPQQRQQQPEGAAPIVVAGRAWYPKPAVVVPTPTSLKRAREEALPETYAGGYDDDQGQAEQSESPSPTPAQPGGWGQPPQQQQPQRQISSADPMASIPCPYFSIGTCDKGDACRFLHGEKSAVSQPGGGVCVRFQQGRCNRGNLCPLMHGKLPDRVHSSTAKICPFYASGKCERGDACRFLHTGKAPPPFVVEPCKFFPLGRCFRGDDCRFSHDVERLPCPYYPLGKCEREDNCKFSHEDAATAPTPAAAVVPVPVRREGAPPAVVPAAPVVPVLIRQGGPSATPCLFFQQGKCNKGDNCKFSHKTQRAGAGLLSHRQDAYQKAACPYVTLAACQHGDGCGYSHSDANPHAPSGPPAYRYNTPGNKCSL